MTLHILLPGLSRQNLKQPVPSLDNSPISGIRDKERAICHNWGIYFRSNLEWDWDTASCMERLFMLPGSEEVGSPAAPIFATVDLDVMDPNTWTLSTHTRGRLPRQMRVAYTSATRGTRYMTFVRVGSTGTSAADVEPEGGFEQVGDGIEEVREVSERDLVVTDNGYGGKSADKSSWEQAMKGLDTVRGHQVDRISICSLD